MSDMLRNVLAVFVIIALAFGGGFGGGYYCATPKSLAGKDAGAMSTIRTKVVYRDYPGMPREDLESKLKCYDTAPPKLDVAIAGKYGTASAQLCDRKWDRDFVVGSSGNWKFAVGLGIGLAVAAGTGYAVYRLSSK